MPLTKVEVSEFKLSLREMSREAYQKLFPGEPACDPTLYPHERLIELEESPPPPVFTDCDGIPRFALLQELRTVLNSLKLPVQVAIQGDELHVRFRHLPPALIQCMNDLDTERGIMDQNYRAALRLQALVKHLVPTIIEKLIVVR